MGASIIMAYTQRMRDRHWLRRVKQSPTKTPPFILARSAQTERDISVRNADRYMPWCADERQHRLEALRTTRMPQKEPTYFRSVTSSKSTDFNAVFTVIPRLHDTTRLSSRLYNRLDNRLYRVNKHPTGCQPGCRLNVCIHDTTGCQTGLRTGLITGCIVYTNIHPVVKPV